MINIRTEYSFKKVFGHIDRVAVVCAEQGLKVATIADMDNTFGHVQWKKACNKACIKPCYGVQLRVYNTLERERKLPNFWYTFIAKNDAGLKEVYDLVSAAYSEDHFYYNPRLGYSEDVKTISGNVLKISPGHSLAPNRFGKIISEELYSGFDNYYPNPEDRIVYELAVEKFDKKTTSQYILSKENWLRSFPDLEHVWDSTEKILESFTADLPVAPMVRFEGKWDIREQCTIGAKIRNIDLKDPVYKKRMEMEIGLIESKDFVDYFAVVADMINYAKQHMLVGPSRGSSAGSLVCYLVGITEVDPIPFGLIFERFIDITRYDLPDIDIDFPDNKRQLVIDYLKDKYGNSNVSHIGTVSRWKPKSAIGLFAKALQIPTYETQAIKDAIIERSGGDARAAMCIKDTIESTDAGKEFIEKYPAMSLVEHIENHASHSGIHAAGIIVCNEPVTKYTGFNSRDNISMIDKHDAEDLNLLKIDILGLRTLTVLEQTLEQIGKTYDWLYQLPLDDEKTFKLFNDMRLAGVFQFEGYALQSLTRQMTVEEFNDIVAITSLARPGPLHCGGATDFIERRTGLKKVEYIHEKIAPMTEDTLGAIVYQEQVMRVVKEIGDFSWEDTGTIRKCMSKTLGEEFFNQYKVKFIEGCANKDITEKEAVVIWETIMTFGSWAFNKCIAGKTKIRMGATGGSIKEWMTIEELYIKYIDKPTAWAKNRMPIIQSLYPDGRIYPQKVKDIFKNGLKRCHEYKFDDGTKIICTKDHKFLINNKWLKIDNAKIGDYFLASNYEKQKYNLTTGKGHVKGNKYNVPQEGFPEGEANPAWMNGKSKEIKEFREKHIGDRCDDCNKKHRRMEVHHKDESKGNINPKDLEWLCPSCHKKKHYGLGRTKKWGKGHETVTRMLISKKYIGYKETYDIEMEEHHNYILEGGIITHNSHAVSYGLISYWSAYLKAHFPSEFAVASLNNARDDAQGVKMLRDMVENEGTKYKAVDVELSDINWTVHDEVLIGGFTNLKGIGIVKAKQILSKRKKGEPQTKAMQKNIDLAITPYNDLFPVKTRFKDWYENPEEHNIVSGKLAYLKEVQKDGVYIFIGKLVDRNLRDLNEYGNVVKRGGKLVTSHNLFLNFTVEDDTDSIICTIDRYKYTKIGKPIAESGKIGEDFYLIKGHLKNGWRKIYVDKVKKL